MILLQSPLWQFFNLSFLTATIPKVWKSAYVFPLLKSGDPSVVNNYRPISKLSILVKVFESFVNIQLKQFLLENNILSEIQAGFRSGHSTITAAMLVTNDIINTLDKKQHCAALFVDLAKAFDSVDHEILLYRLGRIGFQSEHDVSWQRIVKQVFLEINKGLPQGSILAPVLFSIFINDLGNGIHTANLHLYADDTVLYSCASSPIQVMEDLQAAFNCLQTSGSQTCLK